MHNDWIVKKNTPLNGGEFQSYRDYCIDNIFGQIIICGGMALTSIPLTFCVTGLHCPGFIYFCLFLNAIYGGISLVALAGTAITKPCREASEQVQKKTFAAIMEEHDVD